MISAFLQRARFPWGGRGVEASSDTVVLRRRRIYILPTRNGLLLAVVLAAMLFGAINYGNSLAYALTFLLTSVAIISIFHTYRNLAGLTVQAGLCRPVFAGEQAVFPLGLNGGSSARYAVVVELPAGKTVIADVPARGVLWVELRLPSSRRGWMERGRITIASGFPLGLFRAWSHVNLPQRCLVYPRPEQEGPPPTAAHGEGEGRTTGQGSEDFDALREYRAGDHLKHVHWKALAREQGLLTKTFSGSGSRDFLLDWNALGGLGAEARLARLCRWVLWADTQGQRYELMLPGIQIPSSHGGNHRQRCLQTLALFGVEP